jgi:ribose/xylose/arabinose/galactoside ABC-type transport system permease subunit
LYRVGLPELETVTGEAGHSGEVRKRLPGFVISEYWVLYLSAVCFLVLLPFTPRLASLENIRNIFSNMLPLLVVAVGETIVLITGGIDLSVTAVIGLSSVIGASIMTSDQGLLGGSPVAAAAGIGGMVLVGLAVGWLNGLSVAWLRMPPFIATLTSMMFFSGLAVWLTQSRPIYDLPARFNQLGQGDWLWVPNPLIVAGAVAALAHILLSRSLPGRWIYAVGASARTALISGVPVSRVVTFAYVVSGCCAAVASVLYTARLETGSPVLGQRILLDVIGATVIGGTSLFGGKGRVLWTVMGVWFICLIDNSLNMLGLSYFLVMIVKGGIILFAALVDAARTRALAGDGRRIP